MEPNAETTQTDIAVIGGGLAGLTAARIAQRAGAHVVVLDGQPAGGRARSDNVDGFLFNRGPHALYSGGAAERILGELGVQVTGGSPSSDAFGLLDGRVGRLPANARTMLTSHLLGVRAKAALGRLLSALGKWDAHALARVTVRDWVDGLRLPREAALMMEMLVRTASYANAPELMSAELAVSQVQMALSHGVRYLDGGWQSLVDGLAVGVDVRRAQALSITRDDDRLVVATVDHANGDSSGHAHVVADAVVLASGTPASMAGLLGRQPFDVGPPIEAACLDLGLAGAPAHPVLFGVDVPLYASVHQPPARLAPPECQVLHVARYLGPGDDRGPGEVRAELDAHARRAGVADGSITASRYLHRMTVVGALTTAASGGFAGRIQVTDAGVDGVFLAGDWIGAHGHLADASMASAAEAARLASARVRARA
ncbi:MAG: putative dehydrogenase [Ilumatobacteraceae bacterium]|nr:putative dehydrogenase [Ilumatobacteraceae bacterium]